MKIKFGFKDIKNINKIYILPNLKNYKILTFKGPLGAGKTSLIKEILRSCGIKEIITSPTFNYVNIYKAENSINIYYHFDLYRINSLSEFIALGFDEILHSCVTDKQSWCLIEWPEVIKHLLDQENFKKNILEISLSYNQDDLYSRILDINKS
ncbi:tRNA (adenosine(37)-N6)-threonylcarbamoyltransferase complex ATPase subunit type 1 TsaE [Candidatus Babeliales bacterium]|nr:tRNA (adenosine(37)-N6)-threonylcarbamoyltransferase complex ATPase subunit type 1 TsaE [Candidatus Babeliales bacterium]MCF7899347.1 tRNA (adenosine(37)-N6)-threonylcarbamoyltransferase complex ATPase subunit type 1 TsaE [Candidatus Babeliales bacterium]